MNVKTLAAVVGTLSLGSLATGCATARPASAVSPEKGSDYACKVDSAAHKRADAADSSSTSTATAEKGGEHKCGNASCGGAGNPQ